ncbi:MAG: hypothetical protein K2Q01_09265 [Rickettsiales bacterium]|nr:hypothetical protein [Rickettsiales bacterium]
MENYLKVFLEAAWTNSLVPFAPDATFSAMKLFGGYNMHMAAILATAGASLGLLLNWLIGQGLLKMHAKSNLHVSEQRYQRVSYLFNKYGIFLLLFSWVPLMKIIMLLAGFLNAPLKFVMPLVVVGQLFFYLSQII